MNLLSTLPRNWIHGLYFQDDWKALPNLTLNLGVRWQVQSTMNNKYGQQSSFDPTAPDNVVAGAMGVITHPGQLYDKDWNNFQPRIGLAWTRAAKPRGSQPGSRSPRWTIACRVREPRSTARSRPGSTRHPGISRRGSSSARVPLLPLVWPVIRADGTIPYASTNYSSRSATWMDPNRKSPYSMNWNFGVQYSLSAQLPGGNELHRQPQRQRL